MAKATSGLGQFRGKVGSVVFRVSQGQQIASAYQPAVKNPKSNLQTAQRNKMYLASQISKLVPREDIVGLAPRGSVRDRRNMFIRNIIDNAVSSLNGNVFATSINGEQLMFSSGDDAQFLAFGTPSSGPITVQISTEIGEELYNKLAIKIIQIDIENNVYSAYKSSWLELPPFSSAVNDTISIELSTTTDYAYLYAIPVTLNDGYGYSAERKTLIQNTTGGNLTIAGEYAISSAVYKWWKSVMIDSGNSGEIIPPSTGGDSVVNPDGPSFPNLG